MSIPNVHSPDCGRTAATPREAFGVRGARSRFWTHSRGRKRQQPVAAYRIPWYTWVCSGGANSSVRSAMFIASLATEAAKLRRSGMCSRLRMHSRYLRSCRSYGAWLDVRGQSAPITMALLTELARLRHGKKRVRRGASWRHCKGFAQQAVANLGSDLC